MEVVLRYVTVNSSDDPGRLCQLLIINFKYLVHKTFLFLPQLGHWKITKNEGSKNSSNATKSIVI